jgi:hypothetical protein
MQRVKTAARASKDRHKKLKVVCVITIRECIVLATLRSLLRYYKCSVS